MFRNIKFTVILLVCLVVSTSFITLGYFNYSASNKFIKNGVEFTYIPLLREKITHNIRNQFMPKVHVCAVLANVSFLKDWIGKSEQKTELITQYLNEIKEEFGYNLTFFVSDSSKTYYTNDSILKTISVDAPLDRWYYNFIRSGKRYEFNINNNSDKNNTLYFFLNYRVEDDNGNLLGVIGIGEEMNSFSNFLAEQESVYRQRIYLVDKKGVIQDHSDISKIKKRTLYDLQGVQEVADTLLSSFEDPIIAGYEVDNTEYMVSSKYIKDIDWYLIIEQNKTRILKTAGQNLRNTVVAGILVLLLLLTILIFIINHFNGKLEFMALRDPLTSCYNRREFHKQLENAIARKNRQNIPTTLVMIDVDYFKTINDTYGHQAGDLVLKSISDLFRNTIRPYDILCRIGGDEFAIIFNSNSKDTISVVIRVQKELSKLKLMSKAGEEITVTLSMGMYEITEPDTYMMIIDKTDQALYKAKEAGRDCFKLYQNQ